MRYVFYGQEFHTFIGQCCREWVLVYGAKPARCGLCGEVPEFLREDHQ